MGAVAASGRADDHPDQLFALGAGEPSYPHPAFLDQFFWARYQASQDSGHGLDYISSSGGGGRIGPSKERRSDSMGRGAVAWVRQDRLASVSPGANPESTRGTLAERP
ncbi:MAG: hypothetical protein ACRDRH_20680 [Pseudonocardia sp.]